MVNGRSYRDVAAPGLVEHHNGYQPVLLLIKEVCIHCHRIICLGSQLLSASNAIV